MRWPFSDPGMLDLLRGTPVSVLVVPWADGSPADAGQPHALGALRDADAVWPGMRPMKTGRDVDAVSGATSRPWIDSNAWYVRLARALMAPRAVWLAFDPPDTGRAMLQAALSE